ncbi:hypothetical protein AB0M34_04830 [Nocardia sp. NPDC050193]
MTVLGGGEAIARMLQATKRLVDALVGRGAPRVSELHHEFPHEIRHGLRQVTQKDKPIEFDKIGPAAHTGRATTAGHPGTGADAGRPIRGSDPTAEDGFLDLREFHESLCDRYNNDSRQSGSNAYQLAAEFQKQLISAHSWEGPFHGRHSRVAMNFLLEQAGKPPSAVAEFDHDLFTPSSRWADEVEAGSDRYSRWQHKLEQSGGDVDPVDLSDLRPMMQRYQQLDGQPSPFTPGEWHDTDKYERLHAQLRSAE